MRITMKLPRVNILTIAVALLCLAVLAGCTTVSPKPTPDIAAPPVEAAPSEDVSPAEAAPEVIAEPPAEVAPAEATPPPKAIHEPGKKYVRITNLDDNETELDENCYKCGTTAFEFVTAMEGTGFFPAKGYRYEIIKDSIIIYKGMYLLDENKKLISATPTITLAWLWVEKKSLRSYILILDKLH